MVGCRAMARLRGVNAWRVILSIISEGVEGGLAVAADGGMAYEDSHGRCRLVKPLIAVLAEAAATTARRRVVRPAHFNSFRSPHLDQHVDQAVFEALIVVHSESPVGVFQDPGVGAIACADMDQPAVGRQLEDLARPWPGRRSARFDLNRDDRTVPLDE